MISECLADINKKTELYKFYDEGIQAPLPYICLTDKRKVQNEDMYKNLMDNKPVLLNDLNGCEEVFNVRNLSSAGADLQMGYSRNIDVDSELKRINHYRDACYYDNYKMHPNKMTPQQSRLACHSSVLVKDYNKYKYVEPSKCLNNTQVGSFDVCSSVSNNIDERSTPVSYSFNNGSYCNEWECQKLFHNNTRRKT